MTRRTLSALAVVVAMFPALASAQTAAMSPGTITVTGVGQGRAMPSQLEVSAYITADAELVKDAIVKYADIKRRGVDALKAMDVPDMVVEDQGVALNTPPNPQVMAMMFGGGRPANPEAKASFQIKEELRIVLRGLDKLKPADVMVNIARVIDVAKDSGLTVASGSPSNQYEMNLMQRGFPTPVSTFRLVDPAVARNKAYEAAIVDARAKAEKLADLAGAKLGPILAVQDTLNAPTSDSANTLAMIYGYRMATPPKASDNPASLTASSFDNISLNVSLNVQFALEKK